jgi:hypothetical protein
MAKYQEQRDEKDKLVGYKEILTHLNHCRFIPINNDNRDYRKVLKWITAGGVPDTDPDVLAMAREEKKGEYITEGVARIKARVPEWDTFKEIRKIAAMWSQMSSFTADQIAARDIYVYIKNTAFPNIDAQGTVALVNAIDVKGDTNLKKEKNVIEERWWDIRKERNQLLKDSDYIMVSDAPITTEKKEEWTTYRQSLRDIPQTFSNPDDVTYPDKPE